MPIWELESQPLGEQIVFFGGLASRFFRSMMPMLGMLRLSYFEVVLYGLWLSRNFLHVELCEQEKTPWNLTRCLKESAALRYYHRREL